LERIPPCGRVSGLSLPCFGLSLPCFVELVDDTGRQVRKDKRGAIPAQEPPALKKLSLSPDHWTRQVKGVGSGFWRVVGAADAVEEKARAM
jgi:hypothetical protein